MNWILRKTLTSSWEIKWQRKIFQLNRLKFKLDLIFHTSALLFASSLIFHCTPVAQLYAFLHTKYMKRINIRGSGNLFSFFIVVERIIFSFGTWNVTRGPELRWKFMCGITVDLYELNCEVHQHEMLPLWIGKKINLLHWNVH